MVAAGSTVDVGSQEVIFKMAPWLEPVLLAVAVGSTVAVGSMVAVGSTVDVRSRGALFKTVPWSEHVLLAVAVGTTVAVGSTVALGSRKVHFTIAP